MRPKEPPVMDTNHRHFPSEIAELIIHFTSDPFSDLFRRIPNRDPGHKRLLLVCALVCKTWLWPARYRLLSLDFSLRTVKVFPHDLLTFFDIFRSPLCTLGPGFVQVLEVLAQPGSEAETTVSIFTLLSTLDRIPLPSLHTLCFRGVSLSFGKDEDDSSSSGTPTSIIISQSMILSQIKNLAFENLNHNPLAFEDVVYTTHFFPSLETLTARGTTLNQHRNAVVYSLRPPQSLRRLDVDRQTMLHMADWLAAFEPKHTGISLLSLYDPTGDHNGQHNISHLSLAVSALGPSLEEFELNLFSMRYFHEHVFPFTNNSSLKRFLIRGELEILVGFVPYICLTIVSLPHLETLEMFIEPWDEKLFSLLVGFPFLDEHAGSHPSLQRIIFTREHVFGDRGWGTFKNDMREYLSRCVEKDMITFRKSPWEGDD